MNSTLNRIGTKNSCLNNDGGIEYIFDFEKDGDVETRKAVREALDQKVEEAGPKWNLKYKLPDFKVMRKFANNTYANSKLKSAIDIELEGPWKLLMRAKRNLFKVFGGFYGELFLNTENNYLLLALKGTDSAVDIKTDVVNVAGGYSGGEIDAAFTFGEKIRNFINSFEVKPILLITGHSLGGFLAQIVTYTITHCFVAEDGKTILSSREPSDFAIYTVVFDSPAALKKILSMHPHDPILFDFFRLNITNFIFKLNLVNHFKWLGPHFGQVLALKEFESSGEVGLIDWLKNSFYCHGIANFENIQEEMLQSVTELKIRETKKYNRSAIPLSFFSISDVRRLKSYISLPEMCKDLIGKLPKFSCPLSEIIIEDENVFVEEFLPQAIQVLRNSREFLDCPELQSTINNFSGGKPKSSGKTQIYSNQAISRKGAGQRFQHAVEFAHELKKGELQFVLISSDAGMGKSTALKQIAETLQSELPHKLIAHINLSTVQNELKEVEKQLAMEKVTEEFIKKCFLAEFTNLLQKYFTKKFETKDIVVLFDSLDEICPTHRDTAERLIALLREAEIQLVVATRPLKGNNFSGAEVFSLEPLYTEELKIEFLDKKFESLKKEKPSDLSAWLKKVTGGIESDFWNIPLFLAMAVSIYGTEVKFSEGRLLQRKHNIYEAFLKAAIEGTLKNKFKLEKNKATHVHLVNTYEGMYKELIEILAICTIFYSGQVNKVKEMLEKHKDYEEHISRFDIAKLYNNSELVSFVHKSYAEYLVANVFLRQLQTGKDQPQLCTSQIKQIFFDDDFDEIRAHFSGILAYSTTPEFQVFYSSISKLLQRNTRNTL